MFSKLAQLAGLATLANAVSIAKSRKQQLLEESEASEAPPVIMYSDYNCGEVSQELEEGAGKGSGLAIGSFKFDDDDTCLCIYSDPEEGPSRDNCWTSADSWSSDGCVVNFMSFVKFDVFEDCPV